MFIYIKLIEKLPQNELFVCTLRSLYEFKTNQLDSTFNLLWRNFFQWYIWNSPLRTNESYEGFIIRDVQTEIVVKIVELLS